VIKWPPNYLTVVFWLPPLVKTVKLDGKYKRTLFFGVKLLKCPFEKKNQFKKCPPKTTSFLIEKKKRKKKKKNGGLTGEVAVLTFWHGELPQGEDISEVRPNKAKRVAGNHWEVFGFTHRGSRRVVGASEFRSHWRWQGQVTGEAAGLRRSRLPFGGV
jgi:hypothetical protein